MKKVSVVIPCYNAAAWLPKCFLSLAEQTIGMEDLELIFVDDASTDNGRTWEMLLLFERAYPDSVIVIRLEENRRQGGARNEALLYASGEYISFVDADDWVLPGLYETAYQRAKEYDADIVQFDHLYYTDQTGEFRNPKGPEEAFFSIPSVEERKKFLLSETITYGCWNKIYKRALIQTAGVRFAEHVVYEEPLFVYPLLYYGNRFLVISDAFYVYRQNQKSTMHRDMKDDTTLKDHVAVQHAVWKFMKQTAFFEEYYEELKMYFLHTCFYEPLYFAGLRNMDISMERYRALEARIKKEIPDLNQSAYEALIPRQMELYRLAADGMTEEDFLRYMEKLKRK